MAERSVKLLLTADVKGLVSGLKTGQKATQDFGRDLSSFAKNHREQLDTVGKGMMVAGGLVGAGVGLAVKSFADFDKSMSGVQAATHESAQNMELLRTAAINAGADTAFSASEAAQGIEELAKAGVSTKDVMGGGLTGALSLAAAGELGVGEAAETAASAMTQFGLAGKDIPHIADLLAAGAGKAQGSVHDMGMALNQAGLVANATGLSIEETTGGLAAFASAGLVGSDAGTSFKSMLQRLTPQSEKAAKMMDDLGVSAYDSQGNFVGLSEYAGILQEKLSGMTVEQRNATMATLFGSDAVRAANVLYEQGADGIEKWEGAVNDAGFAAETASIRQQNLAGDLEKLGGSLDSVFLKSGSGANEVLRGLVQGLEGIVDAVGNIPAPILNAGLMIAGVGSGAALLGGALITALPKVLDTVDAFKNLAPAGSKARGAIGAVGRAAGITAAALIALEIASRIAGTGIDDLGSAEDTEAAIRRISGDSRQAAADLNELATASGSGGAGINGLGQAFKTVGNNGFLKFLDSAGSMFGIFDSDASLAKESLSRYDDALTTLVASGNFGEAADGFKTAAEQASAQGVGVDAVAKSLPGYTAALRNVAEQVNVNVSDQQLLNWAMTGTAPAAVEAAQALTGIGTQGGAAAAGAETAADGIQSAADAAKEAADALSAMYDGLVSTGQITLSERDALRGYQEAVDGARASLTENGKTLDINTEKGRANQSALDGIASSTLGVVSSMEQTGATAESVAGRVEQGRTAFINQATAMGMSKSAAGKLADQMGLIPSDVYTAFASNAPDLAAKIEILHEQIQSTPNKTITISDNSPETVKALKALGYIVKTLPDGRIQVTENGATPVGKKIDGVASKKRTAIINAAAETATAEGELNHTARPRTSSVLQTVTQKVKQQLVPLKGFPIPQRATGGPIRRATGGPVFGAGTATSDSIPALLSNGEHVITADEVKKLGGHDAVERMRGMAKGGLLAFAKGGRVAAAEKKVASAQRTYSHISGDKANRSRKLAAKDQLDAAKADLKAAKAYEKKSEEQRKAAAEKNQRLFDDRFGLQRDLRRGNIKGDMSTVDKLFDLAKNPDYSKSTRKMASNLANTMERYLVKLEKQSDALATSLETATKRRDELLSVKESVASGLRGEFSLSGVLDSTRQDLGAGLSMGSISGAANARAKRISIFAGRLNRLRKMGYAESIIQEVAGLGSDEGIKVAGVLMNATAKEKTVLNGAYGRLDAASNKAGQYVTESMYKGGLDAADGLVRGLEKRQKSVESAFTRLGKSGIRAFKKAMDSHSPSRKMAAEADNAADGLVNQLGNRLPDVEKAMGAYAAIPEMGSWGTPVVPPSREVSAHAAGAGVDTAAIASAVAGAISQYQPIVSIGGRQFVGVMREAERQATRR